MSQPEKFPAHSENILSDEAEGHDCQALEEPLMPIHHSLRESFVALPPAGTTLSEHQLKSVFGGDWRVLQELAQLAYQPPDSETEL